MKRYTSYKPSGVPWLGDVPAHWEVNTIKRGYEITLGKMLQTEQKASTDVSAPYLRSANVQAEKVDVSDVQTMWFTEHEVQQLALEPNDLVVCEGGDAGRSAIWHGEIDGCYFQNSVNRVRGVGHNTTFYLMRWLGVVKSCGYMDIVCNKATIAHLTKEKLANLPMLFPPPDEQQAIADYLDAETTRIDTLIHEKDELIELLKEWRQSMIAEVVTKGLDKTVPMKPSGVPWLGDVPAHWKVKKLKHLVKALVGGATPTTSEPALWDDVNGTPWVAIGDMSNRYSVMATNRKVSSEGILEKRMQILRAGTVIYSMYASVGYASILGVDAVTNQAILGLITTDTLNNKFFMNYLNSIRESVLQEASSNTQDNINAEKVRRIPLLCPPLEEQQAIADYLDTETAKIDALIEHAKDDIVLLKELRAATIADAVLGRIDVRTPSLHV